MVKFAYIVIDSKHNALNGTLELEDRASVIASLTKQGLRPISIREVAISNSFDFSSLLKKSEKIKSDDLVIMTRQLSAMVGAGVPLTRALNSLSQHSESSKLRSVLGLIIKDVEGGSGFGNALQKHPDVFNDIYVNMVKAGETAGILDEILNRLALQQEKSMAIRKKIKSAMTYPMVLVSITVLAFFGLMLFVIPQIERILKDLGGPDAQLPLITQVMIGISGFITGRWYILFPLIFVGIYMFLRYVKTPSGKEAVHKLALRTPVVKTLIRKVVIARFSRTFSALLGAGVSVLECLDVTSRSVGNIVYERAIQQAAIEVKNGRPLSAIMSENPLFPAIVPQMLSVGEETGQTDVVLVKVADFYEAEVDVAIEGLSSIIEPVMIVLMGSMVGLIAASVMLPIASLSQNIK